MFRKMPFLLLGIIALLGIAHPWIPISAQSALYAASLSLKSLIIFALPLLIFGLLFKAAVQLSSKASKMILLILAAICASNYLSTLISYGVGTFAYTTDLSLALPQEGAGLEPAWNLSLPKWIGNDYAMFSGLILGVVLGKWKPLLAGSISKRFEKGIAVLMKGLLYVIPVFIAGFVMKMYHDKVRVSILSNYSLIFALVACAVFTYIALIYLVANRFQGKEWARSLKNMLPAAIAGFGSMSSAAAMPLTILGTEKNSSNPDLARSIIPASVNIHLIGDCFAIPIFAFAVMKSFGIAEPSFISYLVFASYFVLAKFSVAAVPGGGILVMLPVLESTLGFNAEMLSLMTALYILFDPVITCANVLGNGGFAMGLSRLVKERSPKTSDV
jgi:hypothetical protein